MKLRTNLVYLVVGTIVPVFLLATFLGFLLVKRERDAFRQGAINRNRAFMAAVDAALQGHISTLQVLASDSSLETNDFNKFLLEATRALKSQGDWQDVILTEPDGRQLVNAALGQRTRTHTTDTESLERLIEQGNPVVGNVCFRDYLGKFGIAVRVPVRQQGRLAFILTAVIEPDQFGRMIRDQHLPEDWISGLVDSTGHYVARVPHRSNADVASTVFMDAIKNGSEGWYRGLTVEGKDTFIVYRNSSFSNWSIGLAIPDTQVNAGALRVTSIMLGGTLITLAVALGFAYWMGRRISKPIASLADAARAMGQDSEPIPIKGEETIQEVRGLAQALSEANDAIHERQILAEREQAALKAADRAKDEFLAMLGHELRNPLAAITTSARVLRLSESPKVASHAHEVIERQTNHMTRLVEDLLNVSRLRMGKITLQKKPFQLGDLVQKVVDMFEQAGRARSGRILVEREAVWVDADPARLEQVLSNLIDNAIKYSPADKPIRVKVRPEGADAVLEVSDDGEGIDPELQEQLFGLFVQGPRGVDRARGGLGLGLALVKQIVEMHGGSIRVISDGPNRGARFVLRFAATTAVETKVEKIVTRRGESRRILVVEDNDDAREMMETMLSLEGHTVRVAAHGTKALEEVCSGGVDVVLLDVGLPDLDGYEVARRMRALDGGEQLKIVALTGYGQAEDQRRAFEAGFDVHLTKPVALEKLREVLRTLTEGKMSAKV